MTKKQIIKVIQGEIEWCLKNREVVITKDFSSMKKDYVDGFIKGLRQAIYLVREMKIDRVIDNKKRSHKKKI